MTIIKNVFFVTEEERITASNNYKVEDREYLGKVSTYASGGAISIFSKHGHNYIPTWILSAICAYLERTRINNKPVIYQDYSFYVYIYKLDCFVEVETKELVKLPI